MHAEIYPSVRAPLTDTIKDSGQVRAMWHWSRDLDESNSLIHKFRIPPGIEADQRKIVSSAAKKVGFWVAEVES